MSRLLVILCGLWMLTGCTGMKEVTSEDPLFLGNDYNFSKSDKYAKEIVNNANDDLNPKPNNTFLWMRPALSRYNMISDSARTKKFWRKRIAPAVTLSQVNPARVAKVVENRLFHGGYFNCHVSYDTVTHGSRKGSYLYQVTLNEPHRFGNIVFPGGTDTLSTKIRESSASTLLKTGMIYSLQTLKDERGRIDRYLKERGYIYFNPDFLSFQADSVTDEGVVHIEIEIKEITPPESRTEFSVSRIFILDDQLEAEGPMDTLKRHPYYLVTTDSTIKLSALQRGIFITPGTFYTRTDRMRTSRYLDNLPIVRATRTQFVETPDSTAKLDALIYLNKHKRFNYSAEFNAIFRSTNYFGPGIVLSFTDRNTRRLAEQLQINLRGRFEMQIAEGQVNPAYEFGIEVNYTLPRIVPSFLDRVGRTKLPRTRVSTGYNLFNRLDLYRLNSFFLDFAYLWRRDERISHSLRVLDIIFTQIPEGSKSEEFNKYLNDNPGVRRSFDEQFVVGVGYDFTLETKSGENGRLFMRLGLDAAGNVLSGVTSLLNTEPDTLGRRKLFGVPFSQFIRTRQEYSYTYLLNPKSQIAARFVAGIGIPYGNSNILPYIKQFYAGGTNSLRSFVARSIGPGGEIPPSGFRDLTGDIRLEWNLEYRFTIDGRLKGALFLDAGNIWLYNYDETRPEGVFRFDTFASQIAVSGGWGIRLDFDFVVARLDLAYNLRTPYEVDGNHWTRKLKFWKPTFNIAIGYPF